MEQICDITYFSFDLKFYFKTIGAQLAWVENWKIEKILLNIKIRK